jgi:hypothetical protein
MNLSSPRECGEEGFVREREGRREARDVVGGRRERIMAGEERE